MSKIVLIASYAPSLINFRGHLIKSLIDLKYEVVACAPNIDEKTKAELKSLGVICREYPLKSTAINIIWDVISFWRLYKIMTEEKPDVVFLYTIKPVIYGSVAARIAGGSNIYSLISGLGSTFLINDIKSRLLNSIIIWMYKVGLSGNKKVFFQNSDDLNLFQSKNMIKSAQKSIVVNGSGVDLDYFKFESNYPQSLTFLLISRLIREKGIYEYIEAAKIIKRKHNHIQFDIVGFFDDNANKIDKKLLKQMHQKNIVNFLGSTTDVRPFIKNSSVYVLPSYYREGIPRSVLEAMSMGRPVITTDMPGCRETVINGENGFLIKPRNISSLVKAMLFFIENSPIIPQMGYESRKIAERKFDVHTVNRDILKGINILK